MTGIFTKISLIFIVNIEVNIPYMDPMGDWDKMFHQISRQN